MRLPRTLKWIGLALLGILVAAAVAVAASRLASRQIGLASEPISAGDTLAPARLAPGGRGSVPKRTETAPPGTGTAQSPGTSAPEPATTTTAPQPRIEGRDDSGDGGDSGGGHEGSDD